MKFFKQNIILSFLVLGILSITINVSSPSFSNQFILEDEFEESLSEVESDNLAEKNIVSKSNGGGNTSLTVESSDQLSIKFDCSSLLFSNEKRSSQKLPFFILYCCLKLDC